MIYSYHEFQDWEVQYLETDNLDTLFTFGFELEVERKENCTMTCAEVSDLIEELYPGLFIFERDASLGDGVEIITQPMTWTWFISKIDIFQNLLKFLDENNFRSHDGNRCGLHIHVAKRCLGLSQLEKEKFYELHFDMDKIIKENKKKTDKIIVNIQFILERFQNELYQFSRRINYVYAKPLTELKTLGNGTKIIEKSLIRNKTKKGLRKGLERYLNLNLKNNETIEFRLLRGTLSWNTFYSSINLIKNIVQMSKVSFNLITFEMIALNGLSVEEKEICKVYCANRGINLNNDDIVQLDDVSIDINEPISKRTLYDKVIRELN